MVGKITKESTSERRNTGCLSEAAIFFEMKRILQILQV